MSFLFALALLAVVSHPAKSQNVAILQSQRWDEILNKMTLEGEENGLSAEFIQHIFKAIHQESINHQKKVISE